MIAPYPDSKRKNKMSRELSLRKIILSLVGFVLLWAVLSDAWGYSEHLHFNGRTYVYAYFSKLVWAAPAGWLIIRFQKPLQFGPKELFSHPVWNKSLAITLGASVLYAAVMMFVTHRGFWFNPDVNPALELIKLALVGIVEETVFRGWGYNALSNAVSEKKAVLISAAFFIAVHWPAYIIKLLRFGTFDFAGILSQSIAALIWGILNCWLLKKGKTLWNPIIAHTVYDVLLVFFVG